MLEKRKILELVPNVKGTAQLIWKVGLAYLLVGTFALWIAELLLSGSVACTVHGFCILHLHGVQADFCT